MMQNDCATYDLQFIYTTGYAYGHGIFTLYMTPVGDQYYTHTVELIIGGHLSIQCKLSTDDRVST